MSFNVLLEKYARLAVVKGVNVQKDQPVVIRATTETKELVRALSKEAYKAGAKEVFVQWSDDYTAHDKLYYASEETLQQVPDYVVAQNQFYLDQGACFISITSPIPGLNSDLDPKKMFVATKAAQSKLSFFQTALMGNHAQWVVIAAPNLVWAEKVFPKLKGKQAIDALWQAIFDASRVTLDKDPVLVWDEHNAYLSKHNKILNDLDFKKLHFKNSLGTDLIVELVKNHVWSGGKEIAKTGVYFNPNIPTEESFTMPYKLGTQGKVVATKPLNYQGKLIDEFWLEFKDGKVINYDAKHDKDALENLLNADNGSSYIGEIALISHQSPISDTNILFYNTLFDENASCHMALGRAYPMNIKGGLESSLEDLQKQGYNHSMVHVDFMFGSSDLEIVGYKQDGTQIKVFEKGNFVI